jgi:serine protease Do
VLKKVKPAIVSVNGASGWIYEASGIIVTNNHVVEGAQSITVRLNDGKTCTPLSVSTDPASDLAVLKIDAGKLPTLVIGDVSRLKVGDSVVAVGNPLGKGIIATQGTISRLGVPGKYYSNIIGTNAELNTGSSGGALVNMAGEIIGITFQKDQEGMGYAINIQEALPVIQRLAQ